MRVAEKIQDACEDFILNISEHERSNNDALTHAVKDLRETIDGGDGPEEASLSIEQINETRTRMEEIYELLSEEERCHNPILESSYEDLFSTLDGIEREALMAESFDEPLCPCGEAFCDCAGAFETDWDEEEE